MELSKNAAPRGPPIRSVGRNLCVKEKTMRENKNPKHSNFNIPGKRSYEYDILTGKLLDSLIPKIILLESKLPTIKARSPTRSRRKQTLSF